MNPASDYSPIVFADQGLLMAASQLGCEAQRQAKRFDRLRKQQLAQRAAEQAAAAHVEQVKSILRGEYVLRPSQLSPVRVAYDPKRQEQLPTHAHLAGAPA